MRTKTAFLTGFLLVSSLTAFGQAGGQRGGQAAPLTETEAPNIPGVVAGGARAIPIRDGFQGTEGPIALPDGSLIFTETNANRITQIGLDDAVSTFLENTNGSNALAWDAQGRLISVQTTAGATRIGVIYPAGREAVLTDNFDGKPFPRPNDLVVNRQGGVYFTDFPFQTPAAGSDALTPAVYYVPPGGPAMRVADGIERPNGIQLSRDERTLYVNNAQGEYMLAFDIQPDGSLQNRRDFARYDGVTRNAQGVANSQADGLAIDSEGRIYSANANGVQVFSPQGQHLGTIPLSRRPQNLAFAGPDKKTLYVVGSSAAFKIQMLAEGFRDRAK